MGGQLGNVAFVIWRESVEALLVIGILNAWLSRQQADAARGKLYLWSGVVAGLLISVAFGLALVLFSETMSDEYAEAVSDRRGADRRRADRADGVLDAPPRPHPEARHRKLAAKRRRPLQLVGRVRAGADRGGARGQRDRGVSLRHAGGGAVGRVRCAAGGGRRLGFVLAVATYYLLQLGSRILSWRTFFRITEVMLLFLGRLAAVDRRRQSDRPRLRCRRCPAGCGIRRPSCRTPARSAG